MSGTLFEYIVIKSQLICILLILIYTVFFHKLEAGQFVIMNLLGN